MHRLLKLTVVAFVGAVPDAMAQDCSGCDMLYQQGAGQCEAFRMYGNEQYDACLMTAQQYASQCLQQCMRGGGYPGTGQSTTLCQEFPNNPACN